MLKTRQLMIAALPLFCLAGMTAASAQDASDWDAEVHSAARLIAGATVKAPDVKSADIRSSGAAAVAAKSADATFVRAGVEIKLDPGWKTYWRDPGDSGAPPRLDFSGSDNVKSVTVLWPSPQRFPDGAGGNSIGYTDHVILPLRVVPADAAKPAALQLKLDYDVCGTMCVPVDADLKLPLHGDGAEEATIEKAEIHVPRRVVLGQGANADGSGGNGLAILAVHREPGDAHERVVVDVAAPPGATVDLFVEGPTPDWSLPLPEPTGSKGSTRQFSFDLDGLPPDAHAAGATLIFTAVSGDDAIEVPAHLD